MVAGCVCEYACMSIVPFPTQPPHPLSYTPSLSLPPHSDQVNVPGDLTAFARAYSGKDDFEFDAEVEAKGEPKLQE